MEKMLFMLVVAVERNISSILFKLDVELSPRVDREEGWPSNGLECPEKDLATRQKYATHRRYA
jgi:hypothetical protein